VGGWCPCAAGKIWRRCRRANHQRLRKPAAPHKRAHTSTHLQFSVLRMSVFIASSQTCSAGMHTRSTKRLSCWTAGSGSSTCHRAHAQPAASANKLCTPVRRTLSYAIIVIGFSGAAAFVWRVVQGRAQDKQHGGGAVVAHASPPLPLPSSSSRNKLGSAAICHNNLVDDLFIYMMLSLVDIAF